MIRKAVKSDLTAVLELYAFLNSQIPETNEKLLEIWDAIHQTPAATL